MKWDSIYKGRAIHIKAKNLRLLMKRLKTELDRIDREA